MRWAKDVVDVNAFSQVTITSRQAHDYLFWPQSITAVLRCTL